MTAIDAAFRRLRASGERGLVVYLTAGDPTPSASLRYLRAAADAGADILEVGVPFSDPTADGPTIEAASRRALASGMNVAGALDLVRRFRRTHPTPVVLFGYCNPFHRYGWPSLCEDAREAGVERITITHPHASFLAYSVDQMIEMGRLGAMLEFHYTFTTPAVRDPVRVAACVYRGVGVGSGVRPPPHEANITSSSSQKWAARLRSLLRRSCRRLFSISRSSLIRR